MLLDSKGPFAVCHPKVNPNVSRTHTQLRIKMHESERIRAQQTLFFRNTLATVCLTCANWMEPFLFCVKPLKPT